MQDGCHKEGVVSSIAISVRAVWCCMSLRSLHFAHAQVVSTECECDVNANTNVNSRTINEHMRMTFAQVLNANVNTTTNVTKNANAPFWLLYTSTRYDDDSGLASLHNFHKLDLPLKNTLYKNFVISQFMYTIMHNCSFCKSIQVGMNLQRIWKLGRNENTQQDYLISVALKLVHCTSCGWSQRRCPFYFCHKAHFAV